MSRAAAVILAAGFSRRLGRSKQTVMVGGEMLVERAVRVAVEAGLSPVIVVVQPEADFLDRLRGCRVVVNQEAVEGMASSIRCGVREASGSHASGVVVMTCDQVRLTAEHLLALLAEPARVTGSRYAGRVGIPAYFPAAVYPDLLELRGDVGARKLLLEAAAVTAEELAVDIDTEEDLAGL